MSAMIGRIEATPGNRDALARMLAEQTPEMPGCLFYLVSVEPGDDSGVWIAECWEDADAHRDWLESDAVTAFREQLAPLMVGYSERHEVTPVGLDLLQ